MPSQERRKRTNANKKTDDDGHLDAAPAQALSNGGGKGAARSTTTTTGKKEGLKSTLRIVSALLSLLCFSYVLYQRFYASPSPASVLETKQGRTYGTAPFAIEPAPVLAREEVDFGEDKEKKEAIVEAFTVSVPAD